MEVEPKTRKPSVRSWVSGTPCETAVWGDAKRWWVRVYDMELAVGLRVRQREARGWGLSQKPENRVSVAWFWACCVKRRCNEMARGGGDPLLQ